MDLSQNFLASRSVSPARAAAVANLIADLEVVPRRSVEYRGTVFEEMDLGAVLQRPPKVALVDERLDANRKKAAV